MDTDNNPIKASYLADKKAIENEIRKGFSDLETMTRKTVPEFIFVRDFLPAFCGEIQMTNDLLSFWYTISNGPFNKVNIINAVGQIVATVPPCKDRDIISSDSKEGNVNEIIQDHEALSKLSPLAANNKLIIGLDNRYGNNINALNSDLSKQWQELMVFYGKVKKQDIAKVDKNNDYEMEID